MNWPRDLCHSPWVVDRLAFGTISDEFGADRPAPMLARPSDRHGPMDRVRRSISLFKQSWAVLKQDRELIWLPVLSTVVAAVIAAIVLVPLALSQGWIDGSATSTGAASGELGPGSYIALAFLTVALAFITVFFRAALVSGAHQRLTGGDPTVKSAIAGAMQRLPQLFTWAVITAIVGSILRAIEERSGWLGRIVVSFIGMAWAVTTFLVIPVIVIEGTGAVPSTKRSVALFRRTWGENLTGQVGFSLIGLIAFIPVVAVAAIGIAVGGPIAIVLVGLAVLAGLAIAAVISALGGVFQTALYHFAAGAELVDSVDGIDANLLRDSFSVKR